MGDKENGELKAKGIFIGSNFTEENKSQINILGERKSFSENPEGILLSKAISGVGKKLNIG